jgi:hypothetical protein
MELDDLRRQWRQTEAADPPLSSTQVDQLLTQRSEGLVEKMRRNARYETVFTVAVALATPVCYALTDNPFYKVQAVFMLLLALGMLGYYIRKLGMLRQMTRTDGDVRGNLQQLCAGLRNMLRFIYRLTLATGPLTLLLLYGFFVGKELARPAEVRADLLLKTGAEMLAFGVLLHWGLVYLTRWYLARLYGQHLDRLESYLHELDE